MKIKLKNGITKEFAEPKKIIDIAKDISMSLFKDAIGARINAQQYVGLDFVISDDVEVEILTSTSSEYEDYLNYTGAVLTLFAVKTIYPNAKLGIISHNQDEMEFGATFSVEPRIKLESLSNLQIEIEKLMLQTIELKSISKDEAIKLVKADKYQLALIEESKNLFVASINGLSLVIDKPIISDNKKIKAIELQQLTGEYWQSNEKNEMFQKIHGIIGKNINALQEKKEIMESRRASDHRIINNKIKAFGFDSLIGPGMPLWLPNGMIIRQEIEKYIKEKEWEYDYIQVKTPVIGTVDLYKTSGHWAHYRNDMFQPFEGGKGSKEEFVLRPMQCPHHALLFKQEPRTYKDMPMRIAEHAMQYRYESSGSLTGLERVRAMELTDSHIFARPDQVKEEFKRTYQMISEVLKTFNIQIDYLSFSVRDPEDKEKYYPDDAMWNKAEADLEGVLKELGLEFERKVGEAAFYGPKLDIQIKTAQNHEITVSTIQLDFLLPKNFDVTYLDADQKLQRPVVIHRGVIGTYERFIATLLEQSKGVLPLWLSPIQVEIIPVGEENENYAEQIKQLMKQNFIRSHVDLRDQRLSWKIREAQTNKIPFQLVLGKTEEKDEAVTYREYGSETQTTISKDEFITKILEKIKTKK